MKLNFLCTGIIERSAIDGQKVYHGELEKAMRAYINEHKSEFLPEGVDSAVIEATPEAAAPGPTEAATGSEGPQAAEDEKKTAGKRDARGLQWAYDTFDGAWQVGSRSAKGAIELIGDTWENSTSTNILAAVIVVLVISNVWTLMRVGTTRKAMNKKIEVRRAEEREKWVQNIVTALWDELEAGKREAAIIRNSVSNQAGYPSPYRPHTPHDLLEPPKSHDDAPNQVNDPSLHQSYTPHDTLEPPTLHDNRPSSIPGPQAWKAEINDLRDTLEAVERRVHAIKESLSKFEQLNALD
jgi:hypothetical protein